MAQRIFKTFSKPASNRIVDDSSPGNVSQPSIYRSRSLAVLSKTYTNFELIGRGTFGEVYKADCNTGSFSEEIAIKKVQIRAPSGRKTFLNLFRTLRKNQLKKYPKLSVTDGPVLPSILPEERTSPTEKRTRKEMDNEIKLWEKLQKKEKHYGLLFLHKVLYVDNECWIVMDMCHLGNLYFFVKNFLFEKNFPLTLDIALDLVSPVLSALRHMHNLGMFHRDVKGENILLTNDFQVKLADFTLCTEFRASKSSEEKTNIKHGSTFSGTPSYSPPESFYGEFFNSTWDSWSVLCLILFIKFGKVCWTMSSSKSLEWTDEKIASFFGEECVKRLHGVEKERRETIEHEYLTAMCVVPKNDLVRKQSDDDFPWCEKRLEFAEFAKKCLCWNFHKRLSCKEICSTDLFVERVAAWDRSPSLAASSLKKKIDDWVNDITFVDDKWLTF